MNLPLPPGNMPVYVATCRGCDTRADHWENGAEEGKALRHALQQAFDGHPRVKVVATGCLGGCECSVPAGRPNHCCSLALMGENRYTYVINGLNPATDIWKVEELVARYLQQKHGLLKLKDHPHKAELSPHITTRTPPTPTPETLETT